MHSRPPIFKMSAFRQTDDESTKGWTPLGQMSPSEGNLQLPEDICFHGPNPERSAAYTLSCRIPLMFAQARHVYADRYTKSLPVQMIHPSPPQHLYLPAHHLPRPKFRNREDGRAIFKLHRATLRRRWNLCRIISNSRMVLPTTRQIFLNTPN